MASFHLSLHVPLVATARSGTACPGDCLGDSLGEAVLNFCINFRSALPEASLAPLLLTRTAGEVRSAQSILGTQEPPKALEPHPAHCMAMR